MITPASPSRFDGGRDILVSGGSPALSWPTPCLST
jgi:hypothetical protein